MNKSVVFILIIWFIVTGFNITKPMHFDDAPFLEMSRKIVQNPLHPYSQKTYWRGTDEPSSTYYHPLLIPYLYATVIKLFGESEILFHIVFSFFSLGGIIFFYLLAKYLMPSFAVVLTILFAVSPSFIPSQNLMTDIPLLTVFLAFFWAIIVSGKNRNEALSFILASLFVGISVLIKYASFILFPILLFAIILKRKWQLLWVLIIPLMVISLWSLFNYFDYGSIHIVSSGKTPLDLHISAMIHRLILWIIGLGSVTPFSLLIFPYILKKRLGQIILLSAVGLSFFVSLYFWQFFGEKLISQILRFYFFANGIFIFSIIPYIFVQKLEEKKQYTGYVISILAIWFWITTIYLFFFVPFVAIRHILLTLPPVLFLFGLVLKEEKKKSFTTYVSLGATVLLGILLGISDYTQAQIYRDYPSQIVQRVKKLNDTSNTNIWFTGNLEMQWYAKKAGMKQYDRTSTVFANGDYVLIPQIMLHEPYLKDMPSLKRIYQIRVEATPVNYFRLISDWPRSLSGYYAFFWETQLPWSISRDPLEEFTIYKVEKNP